MPGPLHLCARSQGDSPRPQLKDTQNFWCLTPDDSTLSTVHGAMVVGASPRRNSLVWSFTGPSVPPLGYPSCDSRSTGLHLRHPTRPPRRPVHRRLQRSPHATTGEGGGSRLLASVSNGIQSLKDLPLLPWLWKEWALLRRDSTPRVVTQALMKAPVSPSSVLTARQSRRDTPPTMVCVDTRFHRCSDPDFPSRTLAG